MVWMLDRCIAHRYKLFALFLVMSGKSLSPQYLFFCPFVSPSNFKLIVRVTEDAFLLKFEDTHSPHHLPPVNASKSV